MFVRMKDVPNRRLSISLECWVRLEIEVFFIWYLEGWMVNLSADKKYISLSEFNLERYRCSEIPFICTSTTLRLADRNSIRYHLICDVSVILWNIFFWPLVSPLDSTSLATCKNISKITKWSLIYMRIHSQRKWWYVDGIWNWWTVSIVLNFSIFIVGREIWSYFYFSRHFFFRWLPLSCGRICVHRQTLCSFCWLAREQTQTDT